MSYRTNNKFATLPRFGPEPPPIEGARWIQLTQGRYALVDEEDYSRVSSCTWRLKNRKNEKCEYAQNGKNQQLHSFILNFPDFEIDHKNNNGLDNRKINLRTCTSSENKRNKRVQGNSSSRHKGIRYKKDGKRIRRWEARIRISNKKNISIGRYLTSEEAAVAYNEAAIKYFGEFANLNEIPAIPTKEID